MDLLLAGVLVGGTAQEAAGDELVVFDFTQPAGRTGWQALHDISGLQGTPTGMVVKISGTDPYLAGPPRDYPSGMLLWLRLRLKSDQAGSGQVFYYPSAPSESDSVRFSVPADQWHEVLVPLPALGAGYRIRIDPPGTGGSCLLGRLSFEERVIFQPPVWPKPLPLPIGPDALTVQSGDLQLRHDRASVGAFEVRVAGQNLAIGNSRAMIGYVINQQSHWIPYGNFTSGSVTSQVSGASIVISAVGDDPDGARWNLEQRFTAVSPGTIQVEITLTADRDRALIYLPVFTVLPGVGTFGTNKTQGLFAGVEYLENEPSSSEADLLAPGSWRQVPDTLKITFPLIAIQAEGRYVGLIWEPQPDLCALFDSPDRQFASGGHVMGLLFPGSDGSNREQRNLLPYQPRFLPANQPLRVRAWIIGNRCETIVPAVQHYVALRGLPPVPSPGQTAGEYFNLAAHGWLDSKIRETNLFRHAYWPGFNAQPASDAALWMFWLSGQASDPALRTRLSTASANALAQVAPQNYNASQIGHVRYPLPALVFGSAMENATQARNRGQALLGRFQSDGLVDYEPPSGGVDYGKTHWARDANGLTASVVLNLLEAAAFSGDRPLLVDAIRHLRAMDRYRNTVPRGAQTWEIPLHTPDILASGYLVRTYTLGYELTGDLQFLDQARYWAWTGVPFVYLQHPTSQPIGIYSTIPVLGATGWVAPVWIGLPVQWCGLVYGAALYRLAQHDSTGPWQQIADGIAAAGIQHTWPLSDAERQGLLPDVFQLRSQSREGPAINPATVLASAINYFDQPRVYDFRAFLRHGLRVHAPGPIGDIIERTDGIGFTVKPWPAAPCQVLVNGFRVAPKVSINNRNTPLAPPHQYQAAEGRLVLQLIQDSTIELIYPATAVLKIRRETNTGMVDLLWLAALGSAGIEARALFAETSPWLTSNAPARLEGDWLVSPRDSMAPQQFFRLRIDP